MPNLEPGDLNGVVAVSSNDVWAVGVTGAGTGQSRTLIEHWNGSTSPNASRYSNVLNAVAAVSSSDVWAVGSYAPAATGK